MLKIKNGSLRIDTPIVMICCRFDDGRDGYLDLAELKRMMEVLGAPQTHLGLKAMIQEVDEDGDGRISFREVGYFYRPPPTSQINKSC